MWFQLLLRILPFALTAVFSAVVVGAPIYAWQSSKVSNLQTTVAQKDAEVAHARTLAAQMETEILQAGINRVEAAVERLRLTQEQWYAQTGKIDRKLSSLSVDAVNGCRIDADSLRDINTLIDSANRRTTTHARQ